MQTSNWKLINASTGKEIFKGDFIVSFRGIIDTCTGATPPHKEGSTGRVSVHGGEYFPSVFGLKWVKE